MSNLKTLLSVETYGTSNEFLAGFIIPDISGGRLNARIRTIKDRHPNISSVKTTVFTNTPIEGAILSESGMAPSCWYSYLTDLVLEDPRGFKLTIPRLPRILTEFLTQATLERGVVKSAITYQVGGTYLNGRARLLEY